jgi:ABC-type transport system involved in multi-copper enzyme maturation permease subunit
MFSIILKNEILKNIKSEIYSILFIIIFIINTFGIISLVINYNQNYKNYKDYVIQHEKTQSKITKVEQVNWDSFYPIRPTPKLSIYFIGIKQLIGLAAVNRNPIPYIFPQTDFGLIIGILMSLLAILLSYNAISGEKEDAILRVILSNPIKRSTLIIAKWVGGIISLVIPLIICFIISLLIIIFFAEVSFSATDCASLFIFFFISLLYISVFYLIGLYISTKTIRSDLSLLISLLIWGLSILVIPTFPDYIGKLFSRTPTGSQFMYTQMMYNHNANKEVDNIKNEYRRKGYNEKDIDSISWPKVEKEYTNRDAQLQKYSNNFDSKMNKQVIISTSVCFLSPYSAYILGGNEICATGISSQVMFQIQASQYQNDCIKYINKNANDSIKKNYIIAGCPKYQYKEVPFSIRIIAAGLPIIFLLIYNILFFILSFKSFNKYDLR